MTKYIVLSTQRSGSTFLGTSLDAHPKIRCCEELFMPKNANPTTYRTYRNLSLERKLKHAFMRRKSICTYLNQTFSDAQKFDAFGFNFLYGQARRFPEVIDWCKQANVKVIHLIRKNTLKVLVSRLVAKKRGVYISTVPVERITVTLNVRTLIPEIQKMESIVDKYQKVFSTFPFMEVFYEDLLAQRSAEYGRIARFLNVDSEGELTTNVVKTSPDRLEELIDNYDDVRRALFDSHPKYFSPE